MPDYNNQVVDVLSRIKELKKANNMTWNDIAAKSGIPATTIKGWYVRKTEPSLSDLRGICWNAFHIADWEFLYNGDFRSELMELASIYEKTWLKLPDKYR